MTSFPIRIALLCVALLPAAARGQAADLKVTVSLERENLLASDSTRAHVWITNPSARIVDSLYMAVHAPRFITVAVGGVRGSAAGLHAALRPLRPHETAAYEVVLRTGIEVEEGDAALAFVVGYRPAARDTGVATPVVIVEKKLQVGLLGSETIGGVSLRLMALLLPGLLFFMVARLGKAGWASQLNATETGVLGVIGSVLLFGALALAWPPTYRSGISILRFLVLCAIAALLAVLAVWADRRVAQWRVRFLVEETDDVDTAVEKLLRRQAEGAWFFSRRKEAEPKPLAVEVRTKASRYVASMTGAAADGRIAVLGWFSITVPPGDQAAFDELDGLRKKGDLVGVLAAMRRRGLHLAMYQAIRKDGAPAGEIERLKEKEVESVTPDPSGAPGLPLITVQV